MLKSFEVNNSNTIPAPGNSELKMTESEKSVENLGPDYDKKLTGDFEKEDFLQWRDGAADFKNFSRQTKGQKIDDLGNYAKAEMQAMFLGEKPTTFCNDFARKNKELFEKFGFKFEGDFCYSPKALEKTIQENPAIFKELGSSTQEVLASLSSADKKKLNIPRGIALGYPAPSVQAFEKISNSGLFETFPKLKNILSESDYKTIRFFNMDHNEISDEQRTIANHLFAKIMLDNKEVLGLDNQALAKMVDTHETYSKSKRIDVNGVIWMDYVDSQESRLKQKRLQTAFQNSGILE